MISDDHWTWLEYNVGEQAQELQQRLANHMIKVRINGMIRHSNTCKKCCQGDPSFSNALHELHREPSQWLREPHSCQCI